MSACDQLQRKRRDRACYVPAEPGVEDAVVGLDRSCKV
jgi:hypothetical protein